MNKNTQITVLGAGVSGLTSAIVLQDKGYRVQIFTKELPHNTTSAVAAAIWFPYEAWPEDKVGKWSYSTFQEFSRLSKIAETGVSFIPFTAYLDTHEEPWWLESLPADHILNDWVESPVNPDHRGFKLLVPLIESPIYLDYLLRRFLSRGGDIIQQEIKDLNQLDDDNIIVNCTGLGAAKLFNDDFVFPIQGQVVKVSSDQSIEGFATEYTMGENGDEIAYIIPRRDCLVLGGSVKRHEYSTTPDQELINRIISYCSDFEPRVEQLEIKESVVGLRPSRTEIRLEKDPQHPIVHNYGHGGAGYTVSWGCAFEVHNIITSMNGMS